MHTSVNNSFPHTFAFYFRSTFSMCRLMSPHLCVFDLFYYYLILLTIFEHIQFFCFPCFLLISEWIALCPKIHSLFLFALRAVTTPLPLFLTDMDYYATHFYLPKTSSSITHIMLQLFYCAFYVWCILHYFQTSFLRYTL